MKVTTTEAAPVLVIHCGTCGAEYTASRAALFEGVRYLACPRCHPPDAEPADGLTEGSLSAPAESPE